MFYEVMRTRDHIRVIGLLLVLHAWMLGDIALFRAVSADRGDLASASWVDPDKSSVPGTQYRIFRSQCVTNEVSYLAYLPPAYEHDTGKRYPVIYWLHGLGGNQRTGSKYIIKLDAAMKAGQAPAMIVVLINGMRSSFYCDSTDGKLPVESVIIKDLIPNVDSSFRTIARREARIVEGASMGAFGALHLAFKYPEVFGAVSSIMAGIHDENSMAEMYPEIFKAIFAGNKDSFRTNSPWYLLEKNAAIIRGRTHIRLWIGDQDLEWRRARTLRFHELLVRLNIEHQFEVVPGVAHSFLPQYDKMGEKNWAFYRDSLSQSVVPK